VPFLVARCDLSVAQPDPSICHSDAPAATTELKRLRAIDKEREKVHNKKLKGTQIHGLGYVLSSPTLSTGWLSRGGLDTPTSTVDVVEEIASPGTKETRSAGAT
jgi:hypothetical protein